MIKQVIAVAAILMATVYGSGDGTTTPADGGQVTPEATPVVAESPTTNPVVEGQSENALTGDSTNPQGGDKQKS